MPKYSDFPTVSFSVGKIFDGTVDPVVLMVFPDDFHSFSFGTIKEDEILNDI